MRSTSSDPGQIADCGSQIADCRVCPRRAARVDLPYRLIFTVLLLAGGVPPAAAGDVTFQGKGVRFVVSGVHGNVLRAAGRTPILGECLDTYRWIDDTGEVAATEADDRVIESRREGGALLLVCENGKVGERIRKRYALVDGGSALAKTVSVGPLKRRGELRVCSSVTLDPGYREGAFYYSPRQSWNASPERELFGVLPAARFTKEVVSATGWDNRMVVAFREGVPAVGHYRWAVRGRHVMPSCLVGAWGVAMEDGLTYTPTGWRFRLLHTLDGEREPVSATAHYLVTPGDFLDVWRRYRAMPEHRAWEERPVPAWATQAKVGGFWSPSPAGGDKDQLEAMRAAAKRLGQATLPMGVFGWCLDGDYETERPFLVESGGVILTPEYVRARLAEFQADPRVRLGLYFQGSLIESTTAAFRDHPEWALQTAEGKPFFSGFRDNPDGAMHFFNVLDEGWCAHYRSRIEAVCRAYNPGWIYCDGGAALETSDYRMRRPVLPDNWNDFYERQQEAARKSDPQRAVLLNSQCWPYGDLYWLECSYFEPDRPWRGAVDFCYDTKILHTPQRSMLPLYWREDARYLALCVAFGFTPTTSGRLGQWNESAWRAIECAYAMRGASLVLSSRAVSPVWWRDGGSLVCFAERVGANVVVPILNFTESDRVRVTVDLAEAGLKGSPRAWVVHPFDQGKDEALGPQSPRAGKLTFDLQVPTGFGGIRLLALGERNLPGR